MITVLYGIVIFASFFTASREFANGYRLSGSFWLVTGFAWCLALFVIVSGLGVIA